jgi:hypothetical protein
MAILRQLPCLGFRGVATVAHAAVANLVHWRSAPSFNVFNFVKLRLAVRCRARQRVRLHKHDRAGSYRLSSH